MYIRIKQVFLIILTIPFGSAFADSATQTDWSGGDGDYGPVWNWDNEFHQSSCINWSDYPGSLLILHGILEYTVDGDFNGAWSVCSEDIDGDGDMDILGAAYWGDEITWWENSDTSPGIYWTEHTIDGDFNGAESVCSKDIDGDGDMDVIGAAAGADDVTWWENIDGSGTYWTEHVVDSIYYHVTSIYSDDIDGDGDMDVLGTAIWDKQITWWENANGSGTSWVQHIIDGHLEAALSVYSEDIDDDGDMDILVAAWEFGIIWWENSDTSPGIYWTEHTIDEGFNSANSVYSEDIDGDGDMDILGSARCTNEISWWENIDGSGTSWAKHTVDEDFCMASSVYSEDMDGDGDMDVLGAARYADEITWWENTDGSGTSWDEHTVDEDFDGAIFVYSEDIDGDGNMDILGAASEGDKITWWKLLDTYSPVGTLESSVFEIAWPVDDSIGWGVISWLEIEPSNTEVSFLVRASNNPENMGLWSDTITVSGTSLAGILGEYDYYLQYMAILKTIHPYTTPILEEITITWDFLGIEETAEPIPINTSLLPIVPNPSAGSLVIRFGLPEPASVDISIFDLSGRLISEIHGGEEYSQGYHNVLLGDFSSGIYFCRMASGDFEATQRFVVIQ